MSAHVLTPPREGPGSSPVVFIRREARFQFVLPLTIAVGGDIFGADSGDRLQQELGEIAESDGIFAGDASLGHEEKSLGEGAIDIGGSGDIGAERFKCRCVRYALGAAFLLGSVMSAELRRRDFFILNRRKLDSLMRRKLILLVDVSPRWVDFRRITTLASIGKGELATRSGSFRRGPSLRFVAQDADPGRIGEFVRRLVGGRFWVALRFELGDYGLQKKSTSGPCGWFFYDSHMRCYHISNHRSTHLLIDCMQGRGYSNKQRILFELRERRRMIGLRSNGRCLCHVEILELQLVGDVDHSLNQRVSFRLSVD